MFCPKCGTQNPETGKFCRKCGTDLGNVSAALTGNLPAQYADTGAVYLNNEARRRKDPNAVYGEALTQIITGIGFLIVAIVLFTTNVAAGQMWWWAMLFPAFGCLGKGIGDYVKSKRMLRQNFQLPNNVGNPNVLRSPSTGELAEIQQLVLSGRKIEAIKVYRESTGAGLAESKHAVDLLEKQLPPQSDYIEPPRGSIYDTGDLQAPPSVTENTTRHLQIDNEGETINLPKK